MQVNKRETYLPQNIQLASLPNYNLSRLITRLYTSNLKPQARIHPSLHSPVSLPKPEHIYSYNHHPLPLQLSQEKVFPSPYPPVSHLISLTHPPPNPIYCPSHTPHQTLHQSTSNHPLRSTKVKKTHQQSVTTTTKAQHKIKVTLPQPPSLPNYSSNSYNPPSESPPSTYFQNPSELPPIHHRSSRSQVPIV